MASQEEIYQLLGKALAEPEFRSELAADPVKAAAGLGVTLSAEEVAGLQASDLSKMAEGLDERLSKRTPLHPPQEDRHLSLTRPARQTGAWQSGPGRGTDQP